MLDFVKPKDNESEFLTAAKELNLKLCFVYNDRKDFSNLKLETPIAGIFDSMPKVREISNFDFVLFDCSKNPRMFAESKIQGIMINCELSEKKDSLVKINSGIDDVIAVIMKKNKKVYGINLSNLFSERIPINVLLRRISQNIRLCRKHGVPFIPLTLVDEPIALKNPEDIKSFLKLFKVDPSDIKTAMSFFDGII
ncbi:MAG: hypothetical protein PWP03_764 [Candidatus Woesearchaeota archaeon]|nr:hypothetical protein [Candidatus Woesearchaeota archaeon]